MSDSLLFLSCFSTHDGRWFVLPPHSKKLRARKIAANVCRTPDAADYNKINP